MYGIILVQYFVYKVKQNEDDGFEKVNNTDTGRFLVEISAGLSKLSLSRRILTGVLVRVSAASPYSDVVMSLASMGYDKKLVEQKIAELVEEFSKESAFNSKTQKEKEDLLFRRAIVSLA